MKVLFLTNLPAQYRVDFFNEFGKTCDLTVVFEAEKTSERDDLWHSHEFNNFTGKYLSHKFEIVKYLNPKKYDVIICSNFSDVVGMIAITYMKTRKINYYLESDGGISKNDSTLKRLVKTFLISGAEGYFCTGEEHKKYYLAYGAVDSKIIPYPFSSVHSSDILDSVVAKEEKKVLKEKLGVTEGKMVLAVGQFIYRKGFDILLNATPNISGDIGVYIVGGEPTVEYLNLAKKLNISNIHFVGYKDKDSLAEYYKAADLFVLPTREDIWGLVINEAMAYALPIITTTKCLAGTELVHSGKNGFLIESENAIDLSEKINFAFSDMEKLVEMSKESLEIVSNYTIETMAKAHSKYFLEK